jgi:hypothetical protein
MHYNINNNTGSKKFFIIRKQISAQQKVNLELFVRKDKGKLGEGK